MYRCFLCVFPVVILFVAWQCLLIKLIVIVMFLAGVLKASMPLCLPMDRWVGPSTVVIVICPATIDVNLIIKWPA